MLKNVVHEIKQFFRPFPEPGSWSYNLQTWFYDQKHPPVEENINIDPSKEVDNGNNNEESVLDVPTYIRRSFTAHVDGHEFNIPVGEFFDNHDPATCSLCQRGMEFRDSGHVAKGGS